MKKIKLFFGLILSLLTSCNVQTLEGKKDERMVHEAIKLASREIIRKYNLHFAGISERADHENECKYKVIGLIFQSHHYISKSEARKIVIDISEIFLSKLNTEEVRPYLTVFPFTEKNLDISVTYTIPRTEWDYSQVAFFGLNCSEVYYWYRIPGEKHKTRDISEPFSEALKIVKEDIALPDQS